MRNPLNVVKKLVAKEDILFKCGFMAVALLCWGRLLNLEGIWYDDWAWVWQYFTTDNYDDFMEPFRSLGRGFLGYIMYPGCKMLDLFHEYATWIFNLLKLFFYIINSYLIYRISRELIAGKILPQLFSLTYLVSPCVTIICSSMLFYQISICAYLLSLWLLVRFFQKGCRFLYFLGSLLLNMVAISNLGSLVFFDVIRFIIILILIRRGGQYGWFQAAKRGVMYWVPFLLIGAAVIVHASFFLPPGPYSSGGRSYDINTVSAIDFILKYIKSLYYIFIEIYVQTLRLALDDETMSPWIILQAIVAALIVCCIIGGALGKKNVAKNSGATEAKEQVRYVLLTAVLLLLSGFFAYVLVRDPPNFGVGSRHAVLGAIGSAIFVPALLFSLFYRGRLSKAVLQLTMAGIVFLGTLQNNMTVEAYRRDWQQQRSFLWQMVWRIPDMKPDTFVLANMHRQEEAYFGPWRGSYELSAPLNMMYARNRSYPEMNKHFVIALDTKSTFRKTWLAQRTNTVIKNKSMQGPPELKPDNLLVASYNGGFLDINQEIEKTDPHLNEINIAPLINNSAPDRILDNKIQGPFPLRRIMGPVPKLHRKLGKGDTRRTLHDRIEDFFFNRKLRIKGRRYYYQTSKLYLERGDYKGLIDLFQEAGSVGYRFASANRLVPYIKAFYIERDFSMAETLLWRWALFGDATKRSAWALLHQIEKEVPDPELLSIVARDIESVFGKKN